MENAHKLSYMAEEIDERLRKAGDAVLCTPQTLTDAQKQQARENIGVGVQPVVIDLGSYDNLGNYDVEGETLSDLLTTLFLGGGGEVRDLHLERLFADLSTPGPIRLKMTFVDSVITVDGASVTADRSGEAHILGFTLVALMAGIFVMTAAMDINGLLQVHVARYEAE